MIWNSDGHDGCPTCRGWGLAASRRCLSCGRSESASRAVLPPWLDRRLGAWLERHELHEIALVPALVPLVLPLPMISLAMFVLAGRRMDWREHLRRWSLVLIAAMANIVLSAWALSEISTGVVALLLEWWSNVLDLVPQNASERGSHQAVPV